MQFILFIAKRIKAGIFQRSLQNLGLNFKRCLKTQIDAKGDFSEAFSFMLEEIEVGIEILENHTVFAAVAFKFLQVLKLSSLAMTILVSSATHYLRSKTMLRS